MKQWLWSKPQCCPLLCAARGTTVLHIQSTPGGRRCCAALWEGQIVHLIRMASATLAARSGAPSPATAWPLSTVEVCTTTDLCNHQVVATEGRCASSRGRRVVRGRARCSGAVRCGWLRHCTHSVLASQRRTHEASDLSFSLAVCLSSDPPRAVLHASVHDNWPTACCLREPSTQDWSERGLAYLVHAARHVRSLGNCS